MGDWDEAHGILDHLSREGLPPELADAARIVSDILDPANSPEEKAKRIARFLPGRYFRVYDDEHGWNDDAMHALASDERRLS